MKKLRYFLGFLTLVSLLIWAVLSNSASFNPASPASSPNLTVSFFDVGQGDSIFVQSPTGYQMLIDGGPSNKVIEELGRKMPFGDRDIDLVILTHPHADHLTGLLDVLKRYNVGQILATDAIHTTPEYLEWLKLIKEKKIPLEMAYQVSAIDLGAGAKAEVLYPKESFKDKKIENLNNTSIVLRLEYAGASFLFMGDLEVEGQKKLIENWKFQIENSTILKVPHHGSKNSLDDEFLTAVSPKTAIISVGEDNPYGHPAKETLEKLKKSGAEIKRTDKDGTIELKF